MDSHLERKTREGVHLPEGQSASFTAAGQLLHGEPDVVDEQLVDYLEQEEGTVEVLKPTRVCRAVSRGGPTFHRRRHAAALNEVFVPNGRHFRCSAIANFDRFGRPFSFC